MKILFYCSKFPPQPGGAGIDAYFLGKDLAEENHHITVICEWKAGLKKFERLNPNYDIYRVTAPILKNSGSGSYFLLLCLAMAAKGIKLLHQLNHDLVHCHDTATGIAALITKMITRKPTVFKFGGSMTYEYLCNSRNHKWDPSSGESWAWKNARGIARVLFSIEKQFYFRFDKIYPIAQYLVDMLKGNFGINSDKIKLIHNGVKTEILKKENFKNVKKMLGINRMIFAGVRFVKYKNLPILIQACKPMLDKYDAHLVIAGSGPEEAEIKALANEHPRIILTGDLPWEENMNYVSSANIFVLPSIVDKTPSCLMEALALEVPCVATDISGVRELIAPGGGILIEKNNPEILTEKIAWIFEHPDEAEQMGKIGRRFIESEFHWESTKQKIKMLYQDLIPSFLNKPQ